MMSAVTKRIEILGYTEDGDFIKKEFTLKYDNRGRTSYTIIRNIHKDDATTRELDLAATK